MLDEAIDLKSDTGYEELYQLTFRAMGSSFDMWVASEAEDAARIALAETRLFIDDAEQVLSRFREDSDLMALNRSAGQRNPVVPMLFEVVRIALDAAKKSAGIYDPTLLDAVVSAGYDRNFSDIQNDDFHFDETDEVLSNSAKQTWKLIELNEPACAITLPPGIRIDLGGIGKAWAAHAAADILEKTGPCIVSAGGDIAVRGEPYPGEGWLVGIRDSKSPGKQVANVEVSSCGVATSGIDQRRWTRNGVTAHHIIDPRTGQPAESDLLSTTVIAPDVLIAERIALTAMVVGSEKALELIENEAGCEGLLVAADGRRISSSRFGALLAPVGGAE